MELGEIFDVGDRFVAYLSLRLVDYSPETQVVCRVVYHGKISHDVADLLAVIESLSADDAVGDAAS